MLIVEYVPSGNVDMYQGEMLTMFQMEMVNTYVPSGDVAYFEVKVYENLERDRWRNKEK